MVGALKANEANIVLYLTTYPSLQELDRVYRNFEVSESGLDRLLVRKFYHLAEMREFLHNDLDEMARTSNIKLIVIDSFAAVVRVEDFDGQSGKGSV